MSIQVSKTCVTGTVVDCYKFALIFNALVNYGDTKLNLLFALILIILSSPCLHLTTCMPIFVHPNWVVLKFFTHADAGQMDGKCFELYLNII